LNLGVKLKWRAWSWGFWYLLKITINIYNFKTEPRTSPFPVVFLKGRKAGHISCGNNFMMILGQNEKNSDNDFRRVSMGE
jgi:hypothetical protein